MEPQNWKSIGEFVGMGAIVASLIFVGFQLRQDRDIALAESLVAAEASFNVINALISDHAEIWLKGQQNEELTDAETLILSRLVNTLHRRARLTAEMRRQLGHAGKEPIRNLAIELYENPVARRFWETQTEKEITYYTSMSPDDDYRRDFRDEVLIELAKLEREKE